MELAEALDNLAICVGRRVRYMLRSSDCAKKLQLCSFNGAFMLTRLPAGISSHGVLVSVSEPKVVAKSCGGLP